jgi:hypothetical protein
MRRGQGLRLRLALIVAAVALVGVGAAAALAPTRDDEPARSPARVDLEHCRLLIADDARRCYTGDFLALVSRADDPRPVVEAITKAVRAQGGLVLASCHVIMHTVGRTYAARAGVTLGTLMNYLPRNNDPGCPAGFAHGLVTGVAPDIDPERPREALSVCGRAQTRFQRYSCIHGFGHAFMRIYEDRLDLALPLCRALGPQAPDCAQGAYHDYWLAVLGADDASAPAGAVRDPRRLCGAQPAMFVRPCWYRAFLENRSDGFTLDTPADVVGACAGLVGLQRHGCITAAALIGPSDPAAQLKVCARLDVADAESCVRGVKVANLLDAPRSAHIGLIDGCGRFVRAARAACYRWLGKALAVVTDGDFAHSGCPRLPPPAARRECAAGAGTMEDPLVTFS